MLAHAQDLEAITDTPGELDGIIETVTGRQTSRMLPEPDLSEEEVIANQRLNPGALRKCGMGTVYCLPR